MSSKPTYTAHKVIEARRDDEKSRWFPIAPVWSHRDGDGFDIELPPGVAVSGRIVVRKREEKDASAAEAEQPTA